MGYPSRRESRPGATRRLRAFALSFALVLQGSSPALAAVAPKVRAVSAALPSPLPPAEALRDAVTASGWAPAPAILLVVTAATPRLVAPAGPQAAFDALSALLRGEPGEDALRRARLGDWLDSLPAGLDSWLGDGHAGVSGGERARIAIARSLLADQPVLVLDEPAAHLDGATAEALAAEVLGGAEGRTVLWITHADAGLDRVDLVLDLGTGRTGT